MADHSDNTLDAQRTIEKCITDVTNMVAKAKQQRHPTDITSFIQQLEKKLYDTIIAPVTDDPPTNRKQTQKVHSELGEKLKALKTLGDKNKIETFNASSTVMDYFDSSIDGSTIPYQMQITYAEHLCKLYATGIIYKKVNGELPKAEQWFKEVRSIMELDSPSTDVKDEVLNTTTKTVTFSDQAPSGTDNKTEILYGRQHLQQLSVNNDDVQSASNADNAMTQDQIDFLVQALIKELRKQIDEHVKKVAAGKDRPLTPDYNLLSLISAAANTAVNTLYKEKDNIKVSKKDILYKITEKSIEMPDEIRSMICNQINTETARSHEIRLHNIIEPLRWLLINICQALDPHFSTARVVKNLMTTEQTIEIGKKAKKEDKENLSEADTTSTDKKTTEEKDKEEREIATKTTSLAKEIETIVSNAMKPKIKPPK